MPGEILTVLEVDKLLILAEKTVYLMAEKRVLPAFEVRDPWRFKRAVIGAWIEQ